VYKRASVDYPGRFAQEEEEEDPNKILFCSKKSRKLSSPNFDISWCYLMSSFLRSSSVRLLSSIQQSPTRGLAMPCNLDGATITV
jgi:hypothetical protein